MDGKSCTNFPQHALGIFFTPNGTSIAQDQFVPLSNNLVELVTMEDNIVTSEELMDELLVNCVSVDEMKQCFGCPRVRINEFPLYSLVQ